MFNAVSDPPVLLRSVLDGVGYFLLSFSDGKSGFITSAHVFSLVTATHPYYRYRADVIKHGVSVKSTTYTTLLYNFSAVLDCYPDLTPTPSLPLSPVLTLKPFVHSGLSVPDDVWINMFSFLDQTSLLLIRYVCHIWAFMAVRFSHRRLRLHLPPDWMLSNRVALFDIFIFESEMALCIFLVHHGLLSAMESVHYINWHLTPCCFFLYLLQKVQEVVVENDPCTLGTVLNIPYPFLLPPTVRSLTLIRCQLTEHSVEGLFSPGTFLHQLVLTSIQGGDVVCVCCLFCNVTHDRLVCSIRAFWVAGGLHCHPMAQCRRHFVSPM